MEMDEIYIPLILRYKILRENRKYLFIMVILDIFLWSGLAIKVGLADVLAKDPFIYVHLPGAIFLVLGSHIIIEKFMKIFNIDIYTGKIIPKESNEFCIISHIYRAGAIEKYQLEILNLICNKKEKSFVLYGVFSVIILALVCDVVLTKNAGTLYCVYEYPWTIIAYIVPLFIYWFILMSPIFFSLLWVLVGIVRGVELMGANCNVKLVSWDGGENTNINMISFKAFRHSIQPVSNLIYLISIVAITFSFIYITSSIFFNIAVLPSFMLYLFSFIFLGFGMALFVWPQLRLHAVLKNAKENVLSEYDQLYECILIQYLNILKEQNGEALKVKDSIKSDLYIMREIIVETEKFDTWPFDISRLYKLTGVGIYIIVTTFLQILTK